MAASRSARSMPIQYGDIGYLLAVFCASCAMTSVVVLALVALVRKISRERGRHQGGETAAVSFKKVLRAPRRTGSDEVSGDSEADHMETVHYFKRAAERRRASPGDKLVNYGPDIVISAVGGNASASESPRSMNSTPVHPIGELLGKLLVCAIYHPARQRLEVNIREAYNVTLVDETSWTQLRVTLTPDRKVKFKTALAQGRNPKFNETFVFTSIDQTKLAEKAVRLRLYRQCGGKRDQMLAEAALPLCLIDGRSGALTNHMLTFAPNQDCALSLSASDYNINSRRGSMVDDDGRFCSSPTGVRPELQVSLCYHDLSGKLVVGIDKGSCFGSMSQPPDTLVKVTVLSVYGDELVKNKTAVRKANAHPHYTETFLFQVAHSEVRQVSLLVQVYSFIGVWRRRVLLGWLSLGQNSTTPSEEEHWAHMVNAMGTTVSKWHVLCEP